MICATASSEANFLLDGSCPARRISARPMRQAGSRFARRSRCCARKVWSSRGRASVGWRPRTGCRRALPCSQQSRGNCHLLAVPLSARCSTSNSSKLRPTSRRYSENACWKPDVSTWPMVHLLLESPSGVPTISARRCRWPTSNGRVFMSCCQSMSAAPPKRSARRSSTPPMPNCSTCPRTLQCWWSSAPRTIEVVRSCWSPNTSSPATSPNSSPSSPLRTTPTPRRACACWTSGAGG